MPYTKEHKQRSRERILESAARLFTTKGFDNTSIDEIMLDAQMTRGAFYAHFANKSELYSQAIIFAASTSRLTVRKPDEMTEQVWLTKILDGYLSMAHINHEESACPVAFLATDIAVRDPLIRKTYTKVFKGMNKIIANNAKAFSDCGDEATLALTAMMIGGVAVGRALDDEKTARKLLNSCKVVAQEIINGK